MIEIVREGFLKIFKKNNYELCKNIKNNLTRNTKNYNNSLIRTIYFYNEDNNYLYIPRYYPINNIIDCEIIDKLNDGFDINIKSNIEFRDELQKESFNYMMSNDCGILCLDTGSGKTIVSIKVVSEIKKKTLILVHRSNLMEQWINKIEEFTNIKLDRGMSILKNNNVRESLNNSIVLSTVQTLHSSLEKHKDEIIHNLKMANFGLLIIDEVHSIVGPEKFSDVSLIIPSKRIFGLSATPYRNDGTSDIMKYHIGPIYKPDNKSDIIMDARVSVIVFNSNMLPRSRGYIYWGGNFQRSRYLSLLKKSESLNNILMGLLYKFKSNRSVFVIIERIKFIEHLYNMFNFDNKNTFMQKDTNDNLKSQFVFATPGKLKEGIDAPEKDTLILTSPIGNIQQACGRVLRSHPNKQMPVIIDLVDINCYDISKTVYNRLKFYKSKNWEIQFLYIDKNISKISEEDMVELIKNN